MDCRVIFIYPNQVILHPTTKLAHFDNPKFREYLVDIALFVKFNLLVLMHKNIILMDAFKDSSSMINVNFALT